MSVHVHSIVAYHENKNKFDRRQKEVLGAFVFNGNQPMTARHIKNVLKYADINAISPRVNELLDLGVLIEHDSIKCPETNKTVRRVKIREIQQGQMQFELERKIV